MKKLYLTSFTFTTGTEEVHKQDRIVMVTSKEVESFKATFTIDYEYDADLYAAQEKAKNWFKANFPESEIISIISHPTITGYMEETVLKHKSLIVDQDDQFSFPNILSGYLSHGINEMPTIDDSESGISRDVVIDLHGTKENFCIGHYNLKHKKWQCYSKETIHEEMKWMDILPL
jgi:hypothetical protein